ncbi:hypothetical protein BDY21DRAFT_194417 [Lineolata rhizophorae]|uniref:Uncharacterized protein n=1 Tax=Lineolata rhizophorae TaxID=578093 RepID=A0A6A6P7B7_9PEZI|nr:hypothetical protein BDY21DRAFT_194417 [Lineolata rhizophorae]
MGISGLLPLLKSIHKPCNLKEFSGQTIGVDAYGWLHRGLLPCAIDIALGKENTKYVDYAMGRVRMLVHFGIRPYIVFDGDYLPSKAGTEKSRADSRSKRRTTGLELLNLGKRGQAYAELAKSVDVTPEMARRLIDALRRANIDYVVAPYEADSQLVYLERQGLTQGTLSEDSDLLVFGAKCLITKLDQYGDCVAINRRDFTACREISLVGWSDEQFRRMAILSGCDYLPSVTNMGLKTAYRMLRKYKSVEGVIRALRFEGKSKVPSDYLQSFHQAEMTFLYQWVFCPRSNQLVNFHDPGEKDINKMPFIGQLVQQDIAIGVARGELHPHTKEPLWELPSVTGSASRSFVPGRRATTVSQSGQHSESKRPTSIQTFFKPKRIPLAELDPNALGLSNSQQGSRSWTAEAAPSLPDMQTPRAHTGLDWSSSQRTISESLPTHRPTAPPMKRQRLCSDQDPGTPARRSSSITAASPFFSTPATDPELVTSAKGSRRSSRRSEVEVWLDDSTEDPKAGPTDIGPGGSISTAESLVSCAERTATDGHSTQAEEQKEATESLMTASKMESQSSHTSLLSSKVSTPATSFGSDGEVLEDSSTSCSAGPISIELLRSTFSYHARKSSLGDLTNYQSYQRSRSHSSIQSLSSARLTSRNPHPNDQSASSSREFQGPGPAKSAIGDDIAEPLSNNRVEPSCKDPGQEETEYISAVPNSPDLLDVANKSSCRSSVEPNVVIPASDDNLMAATESEKSVAVAPNVSWLSEEFAGSRRIGKPKGSEDLLVPDSEVEGDSSDDERDSPKSGPSLSLASFAYVPR